MCAPSVTDFREAERMFAGMHGGWRDRSFGSHDESGMGRIAQLPFWTQEGSFPPSDNELFSEHVLTDPGLGRGGMLPLPPVSG